MRWKYDRSQFRQLVIAALGVLVVACSAAQRDEWLDFRTANEGERQWRELPPMHIHRIAKDVVPEALSMLNNRPVRRLDQREAERLVRRGASPAAGNHFYLVRGVRTTTDRGAFTVLSDGQSLVTRYDVLAKRQPEVQKQPLVVELSRAPQRLYVEYSVAE
jgi:hypothetical protein